MGVRTLVRDIRRYRNWREVHGGKSLLWRVRSPRIDVRLRPGTTDKWIAREVLFDRVYTKYFDVMRGDIVVDIGAHVGAFSLYAHSKGAATIYSFEPNPMNFEALVANLSLNDAKSVRASMLAIIPGPSPRQLHIPTGKHKDRSSVFEIIAEDHDDLSVTCISFDDFLRQNNIRHVDFLKLDAEGAEHDIIAMTESLGAVEKIALEAHDLRGHAKEEVADALRRKGFRTHVDAAPTDGLTLYVYGWR